MKIIYALFALCLTGCASNVKNAQNIEVPIKLADIENVKCDAPIKNDYEFSLTNGKAVPSTRQYCYVWQLEKEDGTVLMKKTGVSKDTQYVSWPLQADVVKKFNSVTESIRDKFVNNGKFSAISDRIEVDNDFRLEQINEDIYISFMSSYNFKATNFITVSDEHNHLELPQDTIMQIVQGMKFKQNETVVMRIPSPYADDNNKFYNVKFKMNVYRQ